MYIIPRSDKIVNNRPIVGSDVIRTLLICDPETTGKYLLIYSTQFVGFNDWVASITAASPISMLP